MMRTLDALIDEAERTLVAAGARAWEICVTEEASTSVEVVDGAVRSQESAIERAIGIRVLDGGLGFAGIGDPTPASLARAAEMAIAEARRVRSARISRFAGPEEGTRGAPFTDPRATGRPRAALVERARALEALTLQHHALVAGVRPAAVSEVWSRFRLRTSSGRDVEEQSTRAFASVGALVESEAGDQLVYAGTSAAAVEALELDAIARRASARAIERLDPATFRTSVVPVILAPEVVAELLEMVAVALGGDLVDRKASFVAGGLGLALFSPAITLLDDPHDPELDGASWLDGEGLPTQARTLIDRGVVCQLLDDLESAARGGRIPGGHAQRTGGDGRPHGGAHALRLLPGSDATEALYRAAAGGLLIQEISGAHTISEVTGAFSLGATGRRVEAGGDLGPAVEGVTISGSLAELFSGGVRPGKDAEIINGSSMPPVLVPALQVASSQ